MTALADVSIFEVTSLSDKFIVGKIDTVFSKFFQKIIRRRRRKFELLLLVVLLLLFLHTELCLFDQCTALNPTLSTGFLFILPSLIVTSTCVFPY